jgi:hypothetical protein
MLLSSLVNNIHHEHRFAAWFKCIIEERISRCWFIMVDTIPCLQMQVTFCRLIIKCVRSIIRKVRWFVWRPMVGLHLSSSSYFHVLCFVSYNSLSLLWFLLWSEDDNDMARFSAARIFPLRSRWTWRASNRATAWHADDNCATLTICFKTHPGIQPYHKHLSNRLRWIQALSFRWPTPRRAHTFWVTPIAYSRGARVAWSHKNRIACR